MSQKQEMLFIIAVTFIIIGCIGAISSPIFGLFESNIFYSTVYFLFGAIAFFIAAHPKKLERFITISAIGFSTISVIELVLQIVGNSAFAISLALTSLHLFFAGIFIYLHFLSTKNQHYYKVA